MAGSERRRVPRALREQLFLRSGGRCECGQCGGTPIEIDTFHVAHLRAHASGGALVLENLAAWHSRCNLLNGSRDVADTRVTPREWQLQALDKVVHRIIHDGAATVSAAPGAGKTILAGLVFEALHDADYIDRMVVLAPRVALVSQWQKALYKARHLEFRPFGAIERRDQLGVISTYQSLTEEELHNHRAQAARSRTLLVLDEVHHVGEPIHGHRPAWARRVSDLAGIVDHDLHVAGVLNLSGTLWRSDPRERISTVRYARSDNDKLVSLVDHEVTTEELIRVGELRPLDLFRLGARVSLADFTDLQVVQSNLVDLDERPARAVLRGLAAQEEFRAGFVAQVLERLEVAHRSLEGHPVKALIVAASQQDARLYEAEANYQMEQRGLRPLARIAISDEKDAPKVLADFANQKRVGVLCTVDMAGEGYDCPDICVIGFATDKLTGLYIRQVVARAMRVTDLERTKGIIPAAVVMPDIEVLVRTLTAYLANDLHEVDTEDPGIWCGGPGGGDGQPRYVLEDAEMTTETVRVPLGGGPEDVDGVLVRDLIPQLEAVNLRGTDAPRFIVAARRMAGERDETNPFDQPSADATVLTDLSIEENCQWMQTTLHKWEKWWTLHGDTTVAAFAGAANASVGLGTGQRPGASVEQLKAIMRWEWDLISKRCEQTGKIPPRRK